MRLGPRPAIKLVLAALVLSGALIWAAVTHIQNVARGTEIILNAQGYDPRGLLTGHYTQVSYAINRATAVSKIAMNERRIGTPVWVAIAPRDGDWMVTAISTGTPPPAPQGSHLVAATASQRYAGSDVVTVVDYDINYGIERIYAQQSEAEALEKLLRTGSDGAEPKLQVIAALGKDGRLRIKGVIAEGVRKDFTWW